MFRHRTTPWIIAAAFFAGQLGLCPLVAQNRVPEINPPPGQTEGNRTQAENVEALTRGPLHEAFAIPFASQPEAGLIVKKRPPEPIEEVPPEAAPTGENVQWIPGYWGWEPTEENFIWVSGLWRNVPPERRWVPGYWTEVQQGYQWVSGFWTSTEEQQLSYLPAPPDTLERGPNIAAPDGDYFWTPGCWIWVDNDYQWRPGYWAEAQEGWIWIPDHYTWTPYGVVFVSGYWDRDFLHRGTLFSPVRFTRIDPGFRFQPLVTIDPQILLVHLFVSRPYDHYHFGDYYAVNDARFGILPWVTFDRQPGWYDPLLTYYQWSYGRRGVDLTQRLVAWNQYFVQHEEFRPPTTFAAQQQFVTKFRGQENVPITQAVFSQPLTEVLATDEGRQQFRTVPDAARQEIVQNLQQFQSIAQQRAELEAVPKALEEPTTKPNQTGQPGGRLAKTLELPQAVTALKPPIATEQPQTTDTPDRRRPEQPGAGRTEQVPAPVRPPERPQQPQPGTRTDRPGARPDQPETRRNDQPGTRPRPDQPETRPDQPGARPDQPGTRPDQPRTQPRPDQPGARPDQPETRPNQPRTQPRPDQPGARPDQPETQPRPGTGSERDANPGNPDRRIPPFNFRRPDQQPPRGQAPGQPGQNPQQADPRNRRGVDSLPPGLRRPEGNPGQPATRPPAQEPRRNPGQASPPPGNPGQAGPPRANPGQAGPPPGNPGQASPPPGNPGQASPPPGNPGQAGPPPGNPGQGGPPQRGEDPPRRGKKEK